MTRTRPVAFLASAAVIPLLALAVSACGGGAATAATPPSTSTSTPAKTPVQTASVKVAKTRLGSILVDSAGLTLYLFKADSGTTSACTGACAKAWPPLRSAGMPTAGSGANAALLGTTPRSDGTPQVTYNGHPLYTFIKDHKPGDVTGQGVVAFGAAWFVVSPKGQQITPAAPAPAKTQPAPAPAKTQPAPAPPANTQPAPAPKPAPPAAKPAPPANGIPQNGGGDGDSDNNGGPSDGDGNV